MRVRSILAVDDSATIRKVVQVVLSKAGHVVQVAADGEEGLRAAAESRPDLILLDFVMPRMNGYQFCRALAERPELREVPVVLMSAKGDQIGERFVRVMGIVDYITKPFSPEALAAVVEHTLAKYAPAPTASDENEDDDDLDELSESGVTGERHTLRLDTDPGPLVHDRTDAHAILAGGPNLDFARTINLAEAAREEAVREAIVAAVAGDDFADEEIAERVRRRLDGPALARLLAEIAPPPPPSDLLSGQLSRVPIAEVLSLLDQQRQSGVLEVRRGSVSISLCFRGGRIDYAGAEGLGEEFLLGTYLVKREAIARADLELFFGSRGPTNKLCGEQLVMLGHVTAEDVRAALSRQTAERVYEVLRWSSGHFSLRTLSPDEPLAARANDVQLALTVEGLLMEGSRRIDEWHLIEREIDDFDVVFLRNEEALARLAADTLGRDEQAVLDLVNAKNSVRDIVRQSRLGTFEVSQMLFRLRTTRLIRRRVQPMAV